VKRAAIPVVFMRAERGNPVEVRSVFVGALR
jgi:hypothetical protein